MFNGSVAGKHFKTKEMNEAFQTITDCFTSYDGGVRYVDLRQFIKDIEDDGSLESKKIIDALLLLSKLINILE